MSILADLASETDDDLGAAGQKELNRRVDAIRLGERELAGYLARIARRSAELAGEGKGTTPEETMRRGGASAKQANREARRSRAGKNSPKISKAVTSGQANPENVDTVARLSGRLTEPDQLEKLRALDGEVAHNVIEMSPESFAQWYRRKLQEIEADNGLAEFERQRAASRLSLHWGSRSMLQVLGELDPEWGEIVQTRIRRLARKLAKADGKPMSDHYQAQALAIICGLKATGTGSGPSAAISVLVDKRTMTDGPHEQTVSETQSGQPIPPQTVGRLACDAAITAIEIDGDGQRLRVGYEKRTATRAQRQALRVLYRTCPLDGVTPFDECEIHHVSFYSTGNGPTDFENLLPISKKWHHLQHEGGWHLKINPDRSLILTSPDGKHNRTIPAPKPPGQAMAA